jgi:HD-like signal output (HDOD) protein
MSDLKQILFVDDEPLVLQGLRRMLRPMRNEWEMNFVESGAAALDFLAQHRVDVVVTDMRMPGMNGAQLLNEVMKHHPQTIRLILSGHADQELILSCVGATHQFLSKPCDPGALRTTISRATNLEAPLKNEALQKLIARMEHLPTIPSIYMEIVEKAQSPDADMEAIGEIIARDIGMTAKVLKLVNSSFFGLRREISSPAEAANYLGLDTVKSLVLSLNAFAQLDDARLGGFSLTALWHHSLTAAVLAKQIINLENGGRKLADEAFTAGLLHDAGKAALAFNFPKDYNNILSQIPHQGHDETLLTAEVVTFGADHANVGGYLLGLWGLPVPVVEAIALHHTPALAPDKSLSPLTAVHAANSIVHSEANDESLPGLNVPYLQSLDLASHVAQWRSNWLAQPAPENTPNEHESPVR